MPAKGNRAIIRRFIEEIFNKRNWDAIDELLHPDFINAVTNVHGRQGYKEMVTEQLSRYSDLQVTIEDMIAEGDKVAYRWTWRGTIEGEKQTLDGMTIQRIVDGKIVEGVFWTREIPEM